MVRVARTLGVTVCLMTLPVSVYAAELSKEDKFVFSNCGRCHVIGEFNRMGGIGSTPSFGALRAMEDWEDRMRSFYALNPHPSFTQIEGVTEPFPDNRPSPIHPIELTLGEVEVIVEFARKIPPKDLGAEIGQR